MIDHTAETVGLTWRKSSHSKGQNNCVETASAPGHAHVRDSKLGTASPILRFPGPAWTAFLTTLR